MSLPSAWHRAWHDYGRRAHISSARMSPAARCPASFQCPPAKLIRPCRLMPLPGRLRCQPLGKRDHRDPRPAAERREAPVRVQQIRDPKVPGGGHPRVEIGRNLDRIAQGREDESRALRARAGRGARHQRLGDRPGVSPSIIFRRAIELAAQAGRELLRHVKVAVLESGLEGSIGLAPDLDRPQGVEKPMLDVTPQPL